jgi:hypothetical protein
MILLGVAFMVFVIMGIGYLFTHSGRGGRIALGIACGVVVLLFLAYVAVASIFAGSGV